MGLLCRVVEPSHRSALEGDAVRVVELCVIQHNSTYVADRIMVRKVRIGPLGHDKRPYLRNIISYHQSATRKAISPFLSFHGRSGPDCAASQSAIAFAFISRSISA